MKKKENANVLKTNVFLNGDSMKLIKKLPDNSIDFIITSPPYNYNCKLPSGRKNGKITRYDKMYDVFHDDMTSKEYCKWTVKLFKQFDRVLKKGGVILYNLSYSTADPSLPEKVIYNIGDKTSFGKIDTLVWEKPKYSPVNSKLYAQRRVEYIYVFVRPNERRNVKTNRKVSSVAANGRVNYKQFSNVIKATNGKKNHLNTATYSTELIDQLIDNYVVDNSTILDPFMGTGTTAVSCINAKRDIKFIGMELSAKQVAYSYDRVKRECGVKLIKPTKGYTQKQRKHFTKSAMVMKFASLIYKIKSLSFKTWGDCIKLAWQLFQNKIRFNNYFKKTNIRTSLKTRYFLDKVDTVLSSTKTLLTKISIVKRALLRINLTPDIKTKVFMIKHALEEKKIAA